MTAIEIVLIIIGITLIIVSIIITEKKNSNSEQGVYELWSEKDEESVNERLNKMIDEQVEQVVAKTQEELKRISNEKIMAVNEFSTQLLDKIEENHKETVFLYHMLDEKEKQIKQITAQDISPQNEVAEDVEEPAKQSTEDLELVIEPPINTESQEEMNEEILTRYRDGKSVLEISKSLGIGQGEVKLVIDIYKEVKK